MKKLLVLLMVLGMASMANATLQISVNGDHDPADSEYTLSAPSAELILDIWTDDTIQSGYGEQYWALTCQMAQASISGGASIFPQDPGIFLYDDAAGAGVILPPGENGVYGAIGLSVISIINPGDEIFDLIAMHCEGPVGDVIVTLWGNADAEPIFQDSVIIHQIPEPMTIAILGLGGLFLRRRK